MYWSAVSVGISYTLTSTVSNTFAHSMALYFSPIDKSDCAITFFFVSTMQYGIQSSVHSQTNAMFLPRYSSDIRPTHYLQ